MAPRSPSALIGMPGTGPTVATQRLKLRPWRAEDLPAFAALNADPAVTAFLPWRLDRSESDALARRLAEEIELCGFGLWAVEAPGVVDFIGFVGLSVPGYEAHFTPCIEVGWRLARAHWGRGYATEAARAALAFGFRDLGLDEIVSFTVPANLRSRRVMERLGMTRSPADDFEHPTLPAGHPLARARALQAAPRELVRRCRPACVAAPWRAWRVRPYDRRA